MREDFHCLRFGIGIKNPIIYPLAKLFECHEQLLVGKEERQGSLDV